MVDLKNEKRKKEDKNPNAKGKKDSQVLILSLGRYVSQGANVELDIHH